VLKLSAKPDLNVLNLNSKASLVSDVVLWLAVITAILLASMWLLGNFKNLRPEAERVQNDVTKMQTLINDACASYNFKYKYNPLTEKGLFLVRDNNICFDSGEIMQCRILLCSTDSNLSINLAYVTELLVNRKNGGRIDVNGL
jgi:hypothetical protein